MIVILLLNIRITREKEIKATNKDIRMNKFKKFKGKVKTEALEDKI